MASRYVDPVGNSDDRAVFMDPFDLPEGSLLTPEEYREAQRLVDSATPPDARTPYRVAVVYPVAPRRGQAPGWWARMSVVAIGLIGAGYYLNDMLAVLR